MLFFQSLENAHASIISRDNILTVSFVMIFEINKYTIFNLKTKFSIRRNALTHITLCVEKLWNLSPVELCNSFFLGYCAGKSEPIIEGGGDIPKTSRLCANLFLPASPFISFKAMRRILLSSILNKYSSILLNTLRKAFHNLSLIPSEL